MDGDRSRGQEAYVSRIRGYCTDAMIFPDHPAMGCVVLHPRRSRDLHIMAYTVLAFW